VLLAALPELGLGSLDHTDARAASCSRTAQLALAGHGPMLPTPLLLLAADDAGAPGEAPPLAALVGATLCSGAVHRGQAGSSGGAAGVAAAMDAGAVREACHAAAERVPAAELPSTARALAFWCAFATADLNRHNGGGGEDNQAARRHTERGFVSLLGVCGAVLTRARAVASYAPGASTAARRALLASPALTAGFLRHGPVIAAAVADLVMRDVEEEEASLFSSGSGGSPG